MACKTIFWGGEGRTKKKKKERDESMDGGELLGLDYDSIDGCTSYHLADVY